MLEESIKHTEMYDFYKAMGDKRTAKKVADEFKVSLSYVAKLRKKNQWKEVIQEYGTEIKKNKKYLNKYY